jgi:NAD(P)-dependent dehydrogenase (short-subunit alcohol dehydrogenase family)
MVEPAAILITGATDGLGRRLAIALAAQGAGLLLHGRNPERVERVLGEVREAGAESARGLVADLARLDEVARLADEVLSAGARLRVLVNNAAVGAGAAGAPREVSADGHELRFAVNYLAPFLLSRRLLPGLRASAPSRVVNVASIGQEALDFDDVMLTRAYDSWRAYRQSKLALIMLTFDLAEEVAGTGVTVNALHPATLMPTSMVRESGARSVDRLEDGLAATLRLVADPSLEGVSGGYYDRQSEARAKPQAYDPDARRHLRELSLRLTAGFLAERPAPTRQS